MRFEIQRKELENAATHLLKKQLHQQGYGKVMPFIKTTTQNPLYALALNNSSYKTIYMNVSNTFDSTLYTNFQHFLAYEPKIQKKDEVKKLNFQGLERVIFYQNQQPFLLNTLHGSESNAKIENQLKELFTNLEVIELE